MGTQWPLRPSFRKPGAACSGQEGAGSALPASDPQQHLKGVIGSHYRQHRDNPGPTRKLFPPCFSGLRT